MNFVYAGSVFMVGVLQDFGRHCCFRDNLRSIGFIFKPAVSGAVVELSVLLNDSEAGR